MLVVHFNGVKWVLLFLGRHRTFNQGELVLP